MPKMPKVGDLVTDIWSSPENLLMVVTEKHKGFFKTKVIFIDNSVSMFNKHYNILDVEVYCWPTSRIKIVARG